MIGRGTLTKEVAGYLARTGYEALEDDALRASKDHILYTLGTILAGSSAPGIEQALAGARALSGTSPESTVLVRGEKLPAAFAALINATMGHSRELDINDDPSLINRPSRLFPRHWPRRKSRECFGQRFHRRGLSRRRSRDPSRPRDQSQAGACARYRTRPIRGGRGVRQNTRP